MKDLMTGNWVLLRNSNKPIQVVAIHLKKVGWHSRIDRLNWSRFSEIDPIRLTDEIFQINNYIKDPNVEGIWYGDDDNSTITKKRDGNYIFQYSDENNLEITISLPITFVHELQNVIKFCKINKKIICS